MQSAITENDESVVVAAAVPRALFKNGGGTCSSSMSKCGFVLLLISAACFAYSMLSSMPSSADSEILVENVLLWNETVTSPLYEEGNNLSANLFRYCHMGLTQKPLLIVVKASLADSEARSVVRDTWGRTAVSLNVPVLFAIGLPSNSDSSKMIDEVAMEAEQLKDLLLFDFVDSYRTLPLKIFYALQWYSEKLFPCAFACIYFTDLDTLVNVRNLRKFCNDTVLHGAVQNTIYGCKFFGAPVVRDISDKKLYVSPNVWSNGIFPPYTSGGAGYILTGDVPYKLMRVAERNLDLLHRFHIEDVMWTGVFREKANVSIQNLGGMYYAYDESVNYCNSGFISMHRFTPARLQRIFQEKKCLSVDG